MLVCHGPTGLILATLTTNIAANVVAPANAMVNAAPRSLTFTAGGVITALVGLFSMPWKLYDSFLNFLVAYSVVLGPVVGVVLADYYLIRGRQLDVDALFSSSPQGAYWYQVRVDSSYCLCAGLAYLPHAICEWVGRMVIRCSLFERGLQQGFACRESILWGEPSRQWRVLTLHKVGHGLHVAECIAYGG